MKREDNVKNRITAGEELEIIGPDEPGRPFRNYRIFDLEGHDVQYADHRYQYLLETSEDVADGYILRKRSET